jgi:hypothetical protein
MISGHFTVLNFLLENGLRSGDWVKFVSYFLKSSDGVLYIVVFFCVFVGEDIAI